MVRTRTKHLSIDERTEVGRRARRSASPAASAGWVPAPDRADPVQLLVEQDRTREPDLVPIRHGRMLVSPFSFYRGAATVMAHDLASTPTAGLTVQLCGDAHLVNFGLFASPERLLLFDVNDFDETLPGPFEYDVKRLAASVVVAGRSNGFSRSDAKAAGRASAASYHEAMASFSQMRTLDVWYARLDDDQLKSAIRADASEVLHEAKHGKHHQGKKTRKELRKVEKRAAKIDTKARRHDSLQALSKLAERANGGYRIASRPPIVVPSRDLEAVYGMSSSELDRLVHDELHAYEASLEEDRRSVLERFEVVDTARKVVGVGSVGTRDFIVLLQGRDAEDPLFLQIKEATESVLEAHLPESRFRHPGERVVRGQRMMQAASDIFLGWSGGRGTDRQYYWRQLRDMKGSADVEHMDPASMSFYARTCGWTLARAHARSGDPVAISAYLGDDDGFERGVADFAGRYADQNERDYARFAEQVASGRLEATTGV